MSIPSKLAKAVRKKLIKSSNAKESAKRAEANYDFEKFVDKSAKDQARRRRVKEKYGAEAVAAKRREFYLKVKDTPEFKEQVRKNIKKFYQKAKDRPEFKEAARRRYKKYYEKNKGDPAFREKRNAAVKKHYDKKKKAKK